MQCSKLFCRETKAAAERTVKRSLQPWRSDGHSDMGDSISSTMRSDQILEYIFKVTQTGAADGL
jgi:hypothetical protein